MKKLLFSLMAIVMLSASGFAKESENSVIGIKTNQTTSAVAEDCRNRGGTCLVTLITNGISRTYKKCCDDIIIVVIN